MNNLSRIPRSCGVAVRGNRISVTQGDPPLCADVTSSQIIYATIFTFDAILTFADKYEFSYVRNSCGTFLLEEINHVHEVLLAYFYHFSLIFPYLLTLLSLLIIM